MTFTLKRRKKERRKEYAGPIRSATHLQFVRGFVCILYGKHECEGRIEACHIRTGTDGGMGMKPSDCFTFPACEAAHAEQHRIGEAAFERKHGVSLRKEADELWRISRAGQRYRAQQRMNGHEQPVD